MCNYSYLISLSILMCQIIAVELLYVSLYKPDMFICIDVPNYSSETTVCVIFTYLISLSILMCQIIAVEPISNYAYLLHT